MLDDHELRRVPIQQRACLVGSIVAVNAYRVRRDLLAQRLEQGGYYVHTTPHFLLCTRIVAPAIIVVHWFAPEALDADIGDYFMGELRPLGLASSPGDYADLFVAVVCSFCPTDAKAAMSLYAINTLKRYRSLLNEETSIRPNAPIGVFSALYKCVFALLAGESLLDAGCSFGFLPLLAASHYPMLKRVVGLDIEAGPFGIVRELAAMEGLAQVSFVQADLLSTEGVAKSGYFDSVTLLHVLEHFSEEDMYCVLSHLLPFVQRKLFIAVPYEEGIPEKSYGHLQLFEREKLLALGEWCLKQWGGVGRLYYEDCADGLLVIER